MSLEKISQGFNEYSHNIENVSDLSKSFLELKSQQFDPDKRIGIDKTSELSEEDYKHVFTGFDNYDFGKNFDVKNDKVLGSILSHFVPDKWAETDRSEKKEIISQLENHICDKLGIENVPEIKHSYENSSTYGWFDGSKNELFINEKFSGKPIELIDTMAHELRHAYQFMRGLNPENKLDEMYAFNFKNYIRPEDDFKGYKSQLVESEACAFANLFRNEFVRISGGEA